MRLQDYPYVAIYISDEFIKDSDGNNISTTKNGNEYSFTMAICKDITITAVAGRKYLVNVTANEDCDIVLKDENDNIYTNELCEQRARYEIYLRARLHDNISITCVPIYWLDVNQIIEYTLPNNTTGEPDLWLVKSISTDLTPSGTQTITAMRYYPLYADISLENLATQ